MSSWRRGAKIASALGVALPLWQKAKNRRRRLALMPVGISAGAGMTMRRCRRQATLRALASSDQLHPIEPLGQEQVNGL